MTIPDWTDCGYDDETDTLRGHTYRDGDIIVAAFDEGFGEYDVTVRFLGDAYCGPDDEPVIDLVGIEMARWRHATDDEIKAFETPGEE